MTSGGAMLLDGLKKVLEDGLMATEISDGGGGGALVFVDGGGFGSGGGVSGDCGDVAVVRVGGGIYRAADFLSVRVAGERGRGGRGGSICAPGQVRDYALR